MMAEKKKKKESTFRYKESHEAEETNKLNQKKPFHFPAHG